MYIFLKILLTALIVVAISEISRRSTIIAGIFASIPLTSLLAIIWIYIDTNDLENIKNLSGNILLMIPPSLTFFICLPLFLDMKLEFYLSNPINREDISSWIEQDNWFIINFYNIIKPDRNFFDNLVTYPVREVVQNWIQKSNSIQLSITIFLSWIIQHPTLQP